MSFWCLSLLFFFCRWKNYRLSQNRDSARHRISNSVYIRIIIRQIHCANSIGYHGHIDGKAIDRDSQRLTISSRIEPMDWPKVDRFESTGNCASNQPFASTRSLSGSVVYRQYTSQAYNAMHMQPRVGLRSGWRGMTAKFLKPCT